MSRVHELHHVVITTPQPDAVAAFYADHWGLALAPSSSPGEHTLGCAGSAEPRLIVRSGTPDGAARFALSIRDEAARDAILSEARARSIAIEADPGPSYAGATSLVDPDGNRVTLVVAAPGAPQPSQPGTELGARKLGHIVLWAERSEEMEAFYSWLGLRVTDRTARGMAFLRCNSDHHTLALVKGGRRGLQHVAFDGVSIDVVMRTLAHLKRNGTTCVWGPGRHGPGNNIFTYYKDPAGTLIELYAELEQIADPDRRVAEHFWGPEHKGDTWETAGPVPADFIG